MSGDAVEVIPLMRFCEVSASPSEISQFNPIDEIGIAIDETRSENSARGSAQLSPLACKQPVCRAAHAQKEVCMAWYLVCV